MEKNLPTGETGSEGSNVPQEDMVEINLVVPRAELEQYKQIIGAIAQALEGASAKADQDIAAQTGGEGEDPLSGFGDFLNKQR